MEFNLIQRISRDKLGIASSVAKEFGFDWGKTIEFARAQNLDHVQLFINPDSLKKDLATFLKSGTGLKACFHLPAQAGEATVQYCLHTLHTFVTDNPIVLIQHQQWANTVQRFLPFYPGMILAIENDQPQATPEAFRQYVQEQATLQSVWAVLDIPRFYHQAPEETPFKKITRQIESLLAFLHQQSIPFLVHAIDQSQQGGERSFWKPFLEGDLPWLHFIKIIRNSSDLLKCFVFEYENWNMAKEGIERIVQD